MSRVPVTAANYTDDAARRAKDVMARIMGGTLQVAEIRSMSLDELVTLWRTPTGTTSVLHEAMMWGSVHLVRAAFETIGSNRPNYHMVADSNGNVPLHMFAMRAEAHDVQLTQLVVNGSPIEALRAMNKEGNTPVHLFPLCGNQAAVQLCKARDAGLLARHNSYQQTPEELTLQRMRGDLESQVQSLKKENRRLAHNQSKADDDEEKFKDFYQRMDEELKNRDAEKAEMEAAAKAAAKKIEALEAMRASQAAVMRDALEKKANAEKIAEKLRRECDTAMATVHASNEEIARRTAEVEQRDRDVREQAAALTAAYVEVEALKRDEDSEQKRALEVAEARAQEMERLVESERRSSSTTSLTLAEEKDRARKLEEQLAALRRAHAEVASMRQSLTEEQQRKIAAAEHRAAELQASVDEQRTQRDDAARKLEEQKRATEEARSQLDAMKRRVDELETRKLNAAGDVTNASHELERMRNELERVRREGTEQREQQLKLLNDGNERARADLEKFKSSSDEAQLLRLSLDAERDRNEQWRITAEENEQKIKTLIAELEAARERPISINPPTQSLSHSQLLRRPSASRISTSTHTSITSNGVFGGISAATSSSSSTGSNSSSATIEEQLTSPRSRASMTLTLDARPLPTMAAASDDGSNARFNTKFFANVVSRVLECDVETLAVLVSPKLELNVDAIVDQLEHNLLEALLLKTVQNHHILHATRNAGKMAGTATEAQYNRAAEMFELLVKAGVRWAELPAFVAAHHEHVSSALAAKLANYEQWWPFAEALLAGDKAKDALGAIMRALPTIGDPNHILTHFSTKSTREQFADRNMSYLHIALETYTEHVVPIVTAILGVPEIDVNLRNSHDMTPLHTALMRLHATPHKCAPIVEALLAAGADPTTPCVNAEIVAHWAILAGKAAKQDHDTPAKREAGEAMVRAKLLQRSVSKRAVIGGQRALSTSTTNVEELSTLRTDAQKYTTPLAMAQILGNERLVELLTRTRYRRIETHDLAEMIVDRAMLGCALRESHRSGQLVRYPMLVRYFELLHHILNCFNPYTTSVFLATGTRPTVLSTKLGIALPQSIVDNDERTLCELVNARLRDPQSSETASLRQAIQAASATNGGGAAPPATPRSMGGSSIGDVTRALEQVVADIDGTRDLALVCDLAKRLLRIATAVETHTYSVSDVILKSVGERYDDAVLLAIATFIEQARPSPTAFVYVVARDDAQFGPLVCYDSVLAARGNMTVLQALFASGHVALIEALYARSPDTLEHRFRHDRALLKIAVDCKQPLVLVAIDFMCEHAAARRRRAIEKRESPTDALALAREIKRNQQPLLLEAKTCEAANREHYSLVTTEGSTVLHLCIEQLRDDLLQFALSTVAQQMLLCDAHGRKPFEVAQRMARDPALSEAARATLDACTSLLSSHAHLVVGTLNLTGTMSPRTNGTPTAAPKSPVLELATPIMVARLDTPTSGDKQHTPHRRKHREKPAEPAVDAPFEDVPLADTVDEKPDEATPRKTKRKKHKGDTKELDGE